MASILKYTSTDDKLVRHIGFLAPIPYERGPFVQVSEARIELVKNFIQQSQVQEVKNLVAGRIHYFNRGQVDILDGHLQTLFIEFKEAYHSSSFFSQTRRQLQKDLGLIKEMLDLTEDRIDALEVESNVVEVVALQNNDGREGSEASGRSRSSNVSCPLSISSEDSDEGDIFDFDKNDSVEKIDGAIKNVSSLLSMAGID